MYCFNCSASCLSLGGSYIYTDKLSAHPGIYLVASAPVKTDLVQRPAWITGNGKVRVEGKVRDILGSIPNVGGRLDLGQAVADEPDSVNEQPVGGSLNLEVAEEGVGAEKREDLV